MEIIHNADACKWLYEYALSGEGAAGQRHAAAIINGNDIIRGRNSYKTSPLQLQYQRNEKCVHLHAEIEAIARATRRCGSIKGSELYVIRVGRRGNIASSKPCEGCIKALLTFGVKKVYHS